jgi:hypothetical protein
LHGIPVRSYKIIKKIFLKDKIVIKKLPFYDFNVYGGSSGIFPARYHAWRARSR